MSPAPATDDDATTHASLYRNLSASLAVMDWMVTRYKQLLALGTLSSMLSTIILTFVLKESKSCGFVQRFMSDRSSLGRPRTARVITTDHAVLPAIRITFTDRKRYQQRCPLFNIRKYV